MSATIIPAPGDVPDPDLRLAEIRARKDARRRERAELEAVRAAGLQLRHAAKLQHFKLSQEGNETCRASPAA